VVAGLQQALPVRLQPEPAVGDEVAGAARLLGIAESGEPVRALGDRGRLVVRERDDAEPLPRRGLGAGREEAADDQLVHLPLVLREVGSGGKLPGRVDRRVIGRLLVALGGLDLLLFEEALRVFPERRGDRQLLDQLAGVEILWVHRVISPG